MIEAISFSTFLVFCLRQTKLRIGKRAAASIAMMAIEIKISDGGEPKAFSLDRLFMIAIIFLPFKKNEGLIRFHLLPKGTVKSRLYHAREHLKKQLSKDDADFTD